MAGSVVIQSSFRAQSVVQLDRFVARIQPLALLPPLAVSVKKKQPLSDSIILIGYYVVYFDFNAFSEIIIIALSVDTTIICAWAVYLVLTRK